MDWDSILNWRLLRGSHEFPGRDGGTCINEAAVIAAGFPYREVKSQWDLPPCFCPVISMFALGLNDGMDDETRQRLVPFVVRLAGTRDEGAERARAELLAMRAVNVFAARALGDAGLFKEAAECLRAGSLRAACCAERGIVFVGMMSCAYALGDGVERAVLCASSSARSARRGNFAAAAADAAAAAASAAAAAASAAEGSDAVWDDAIA
ncbi:MAG: hypothetical protein AAFR16_01155, partial [Pseudomonadota bacterium]